MTTRLVFPAALVVRFKRELTAEEIDAVNKQLENFQRVVYSDIEATLTLVTERELPLEDARFEVR